MDADTIELLEDTLEASRDFDHERQKSVTDTFKQVVTSIIIIFSSSISTATTTTEFVRSVTTFIIVTVFAYYIKTSAVLHSAVFYDKVGHYIHEFTVDMLDFIYRFAICITIALIRNYMDYSIDDVPFIIVGVAFYDMCSKIWVRHTQNKKIVYKVTSRKGHRHDRLYNPGD